jgi:hypothetical protein
VPVDCTKKEETYQSLYSTDYSHKNPATIVECFQKLKQKSWPEWNRTCQSADHMGNPTCHCLVYQSGRIWNWDETFEDAKKNIKKASSDFKSKWAQRWEGKMFLAYECDPNPGKSSRRRMPFRY